MPDPLSPLRAATASLETSREAWRHQILEAHWLGYSNRQIAAVAGVSYETVRAVIQGYLSGLTEKSSPKSPGVMRPRL